ncbi:unnamed protein product, partial [Lepidochelys kempii]
MSGCSPIPPDGCGAEARAKGVSGDPRRFSRSERDVDCPSRRSLPGEEVHPSKETSLILPPLTTEKAGRDSTPQPSGGPAVTRCPERWRDKAPLPAHPQPPVAPAQLGKQRLGSTASVCSRQSCKSTASHIQEVAGDDRCAHCALACLFCEFLALCSLVLDGLDCGALCLAGGCCAGGGPPGAGLRGRWLPLRRGVRAPPGLLRPCRLPGNLSGVLLHLLPRL